jgi:hypothetical protein
MTRYLLLFDSYGIVFCGSPSLMRGLVCLLYKLLALASAVILGSESLGTRDLFYCLRFETSLFVASYDSQGHREVKQSSSLLPAISQQGNFWHRAPLGPMVIYLFNVKTFVFSFFRCSSLLIKREGLDYFIIGIPLQHLIPPEVKLT